MSERLIQPITLITATNGKIVNESCEFLRVVKNEYPCCDLKWTINGQDQGYAERAFSKNGGTACEFGSMGRNCYGEHD